MQFLKNISRGERDLTSLKTHSRPWVKRAAAQYVSTQKKLNNLLLLLQNICLLLILLHTKKKSLPKLKTISLKFSFFWLECKSNWFFFLMTETSRIGEKRWREFWHLLVPSPQWKSSHSCHKRCLLFLSTDSWTLKVVCKYIALTQKQGFWHYISAMNVDNQGNRKYIWARRNSKSYLSQQERIVIAWTSWLHASL